MWFILGVCISLFVVLLYLRYFHRKRLRLPPGPPGYPLIGNIFDIKDIDQMHVDLVRFRKQYGDIVYFKMLHLPFVALNSPDLFREAFITAPNAKVMSDRPPSFFGRHILIDDTIFGESYQQIKGQRKIMHKVLRQYGEGLQRIEYLVSTELERFATELGDLKTSPFNPRETLLQSLSNIVAILVIGEHNPETSGCLKAFRTEMNFLLSGGNDALLGFLPFLVKLPWKFRDPFKIAIKERDAILKICYTEHKNTFDPNGEPRGVVDQLLKIQMSQKEKGSEQMSDADIKGITMDIAAGAMNTSSATLEGALLILLHYPNIQRKIQAECDLILNQGRLPRLADRKHMHYVQAFIAEAFRFMTIVPLSLPHACSSDSKIMGYDIPKGTTILLNMWGINHDERFWDRPFEFEPERFLDKDGCFLPAEDPVLQRVMTFSVGKRACPGEVFGRTRVFLYLTTLLSKFTFVAEDERNLPSCHPRDQLPGLNVVYPEYTAKAIPRNV